MPEARLARTRGYCKCPDGVCLYRAGDEPDFCRQRRAPTPRDDYHYTAAREAINKLQRAAAATIGPVEASALAVQAHEGLDLVPGTGPGPTRQPIPSGDY